MNPIDANHRPRREGGARERRGSLAVTERVVRSRRGDAPPGVAPVGGEGPGLRDDGHAPNRQRNGEDRAPHRPKVMTQIATALDIALPEPIRGSLLSLETLETFAETLAASHRVLPGEDNRGQPLLRRLRENGRALLAAQRSILEAVRAEHAISPAAEWFVDNFPVVDEQLREIVDDLPRGFYRELPKLAKGALEGYPRVYAL